MKHNPTGTNLFHAGQAKAMIEYMLDGAVVDDEPFGWLCDVSGRINFYKNKSPEATFSEEFIKRFGNELIAIYTEPQLAAKAIPQDNSKVIASQDETILQLQADLSKSVDLNIEIMQENSHLKYKRVDELQSKLDAVYALPVVACAYINDADECEEIGHIDNYDGIVPNEFTALVALSYKGHDSDCAVHNMPAYPNDACNCTLSKVSDDKADAERYRKARQMGILKYLDADGSHIVCMSDADAFIDAAMKGREL